MRKVLVVVIAAFAVYYLLSQPQGAAGAVRSTVDAMGTAMDSITQFLNALFA